MHPPDEPISEVAEAFSRVAEKYDRMTVDHPNLTRMRAIVYDHLQRHVAPRAKILELNAGSGTDAIHLASLGYHVHAIDIAPGMLARLAEKVAARDLQKQISYQQLSFTELDSVHGGPFDSIFSNLGGLNCLPDLHLVTNLLPRLLKPGGAVVWTLMPPVCLWELAMTLRGDFQTAFRRLKPSGARAHLEGRHFSVYYYSPESAAACFGSEFKQLEIEGLSIFAPTANSQQLPRRFPHLYRFLCRLDQRLAHSRPWRGLGDFYVLSLRYSPG